MARTPESPSPRANDKKTFIRAAGVSGNAAVEDVAVGDGMLVRTASAASAGVTAGAVSDVPEAAQPANARESKAIIPHRRHTFIIAQPYIFTV